MDLVYLNSGLGSVFESQVLSLLEKMQSLHEINRVILFCGYRNNIEKEKIKKLVNLKSIKIHFFKIYPNYPFFNWLNKTSIKNVLHNYSIKTDTIVHIRGETLAMLSLSSLQRIGIPTSNILVDIRGVSLEETIQYSSLHSLIRKIKSKNSRLSITSLKHFSHINVVSQALKDYIIGTPDSCFENIYIIPSLSGPAFVYNQLKRREIRNKLKINEEDCLFVFSSGGTALWQENNAIYYIADLGYKVLNLSPKQIAHPNIFNSFVPYQEVPNYLSAGDIALLIRDQSIVNRVASPVKFSEFVCSGLPVISNGNVNMINDYIQSTGHGMILKDLNKLNSKDIIRLRSISREKISQTGLTNFSVDKISQDYFSVYRRMLKL